MASFLAAADEILRARSGPAEVRESGTLLRRPVFFICLCGLSYGMVMGSFGGFGAAHAWQVLYSATKVPLLLLGTFVICLPSFFVLNMLAGLGSDFRQVAQALLTTQAAATIVLCSFAPFTVLWYLSSSNYHAAIVLNGVLFAISSVAAQGPLRRLYQPLIERNRKHLLLLRVWLGLYLFVGIQLGWLLRPFVGQPDIVVQFFRENAWGNAYVEVLHHLESLILK